MGIKELALSFENIIVSFCVLPCLFLFAICNQSVSPSGPSVIVYILDSGGLRGYNPLENIRYRDPMMRQPMSNGLDSVSVP